METFLSIDLLSDTENTVLSRFITALAGQLNELRRYGITQPTIY